MKKKIYILEKDYGETDIISVNGYGTESNVKDAADKIIKLLLNDISAHAFELVVEKLKERRFIK
jgi:hypothetical protein